ncbi:MAG: phosphoenolpyruvate carboxykinase (ATP) [Phycisphaerales bacterium]|nr:MAG: phosphoenolpyruvate carboxykinase (ATP) [Phycisphaerales bacterium]
MDTGVNPSHYGLEHHGIRNAGVVSWNLGPAALIEEVLRHHEGKLSNNGAVVVRTGHRTGRSPGDKFVVHAEPSCQHIAWGNVNRPFDAKAFDRLHGHLAGYLQGADLYVQDCFAGADPANRLPIRVVTEYAWQSLFARSLFLGPCLDTCGSHVPEFTVIDAPKFHASPDEHGTESEAFVIVNYERKLVLIGGTGYAGEIKKSVFGVLNYLLPRRGILGMHCAANVGSNGDVALFFGLSGTGKTALSADPDRRLIGDDEHGWSDSGVFNFEGGCYAKAIRLSPDAEPQIYNAVRFGTVLENVVLYDQPRRCDYDDPSITENTRAAYPVEYIDNAVVPSIGGHPKNIIFLTCDAFGVLPPVSRLTTEQAMYHFLSGYTAKIAGTERGVTEPAATFSACFGEPFLPLPPREYSRLLGDRLARHGARCWLINTGWSGGPYGVGERIKIGYTRAMVSAALSGALDGVEHRTDSRFGLAVPTSCPDVPAGVLDPRSTWSDPDAYDDKARALAGLFVENFKQFPAVDEKVRAAGPGL